jgi:hypothetical protein
MLLRLQPRYRNKFSGLKLHVETASAKRRTVGLGGLPKADAPDAKK